MLVEESKSDREWETFLQSSSGGTVYHSLKWKEVIEKSFQYTPLYLTIRDAKGQIAGICPGFITKSTNVGVYCSMPHSECGGPIISAPFAQQASLSLRSFLRDVSSNKGIACAKLSFQDDTVARYFESPLGCADTSVGLMEIDLKTTPSELIWNKFFSQNRRRKIRLVEREGYQAQEARTRSDLRDFYNLYRQNMQFISAAPNSYLFFENMWNALYPSNLRIRLVEKNRRVAGVLFIRHAERLYAVYAGMDRTARVHGLINYLWWKEIMRAEEEGLRYVWLGSTPSDRKHPYYAQKKSFGCLFEQQKTLWCPLNPVGCTILLARAKAISTWRSVRNRLPQGLARSIQSRFEKTI
jgi:lipid II:glycine glycyltransferase (peptidoglycan interpeptide bridge formation enzyme)